MNRSDTQGESLPTNSDRAQHRAGRRGRGLLASRWLAGSLVAASMGMALPAVAQQVISVSGGRGGYGNVHIVEPGDTLWDICERYFQDPWRWPNVWAINPQITNPHWIYPGDTVRLNLDPLRGPDRYTADLNNAKVVTQNVGYIAEEKVARMGVLINSPTPKQYLAQEDLVYLDMKDLPNARSGQEFSVFAIRETVTHPETGDDMGRKVQRVGIVRIETVEDNVARARVVRSFYEIERGALVGEMVEPQLVVQPRQNLVDMQGTLVAAMEPVAEYGQFHTVFLDRGAKDGVQVGNRFFVMRRGDGYLELDEDDRKRLPWEEIGEVTVVETQDRNSTGVLVRSRIEVRRGDRVVMQKNY